MLPSKDCILDAADMSSFCPSGSPAVERRPVQLSAAPVGSFRAGRSRIILALDSCQMALTWGQYGDENRLCLRPAHQLYDLLDNAHTLGAQKARAHDPRLHDHTM